MEGEALAMNHLNLHNGTIWRWNRPVLGLQNERLHLRIEHRGPSSGPTIADGVANMAFYLGLVRELAEQKTNPCDQLPHRLVEFNFYRAAQNSLQARLLWVDGKKYPAAQLISEVLIPQARQGLHKLGYHQEEISFFIDEIITHRVKNMQNGAQWQKSFIDKHGKDYQALVTRYIELQQQGNPVHTWNLD